MGGEQRDERRRRQDRCTRAKQLPHATQLRKRIGDRYALSGRAAAAIA
jgi:hypothetical protein